MPFLRGRRAATAARRTSHVEVDTDLERRAELTAKAMRHLQVCSIHRLHLQRSETGVDERARLLHDVVACAHREGHRQLDTLPRQPAEQVVRRLPQRLALNVEQRHVERSESRQHMTAEWHERSRELVESRDRERISSEESRRKPLVDQPAERRAVPVPDQRDLAEAANALIGIDSDEPVLGRRQRAERRLEVKREQHADRDRPNLGDVHAAPRSSSRQTARPGAPVPPRRGSGRNTKIPPRTGNSASLVRPST